MSEIWIEGGMLVFIMMVFLTVVKVAFNIIQTELREVSARLLALEKAFWHLRGLFNGVEHLHENE